MKLENNYTEGKRATEALEEALERVQVTTKEAANNIKKFYELFKKKLMKDGGNNMSMEEMLKEIKESESREKAMKKGKKNKIIKNWEKNRFYQK